MRHQFLPKVFAVFSLLLSFPAHALIQDSNSGSSYIMSSVGIGTTNPDRLLEVSGEIESHDVNAGGGSDGAIRIKGNTSTGYWGGSYGTIQFVNSTGDVQWATIIGNSAGNLLLQVAGGNVGVGIASPSYPLHVNGTAYATGAAGALSDIRHKDEVKSLPDELANIMKLRPVSFKWKQPTDDGMKGEQIGFIAQEVETVLPSVVLTQNDADKTKGLKYTEIIPILTKAMQELKAGDDALRADFAAYKKTHP